MTRDVAHCRLRGCSPGCTHFEAPIAEMFWAKCWRRKSPPHLSDGKRYWSRFLGGRGIVGYFGCRGLTFWTPSLWGIQQIECFQMKISDFSGKQWRGLLILRLVNFVNYVYRQIVFSLFPSIRRDFGLSYVQLGYLATAFTVVLSLVSFPLGMLADRISRRAMISAGVLFWSGATFVSGLAGSFRALLIARGLVGIGEAAYTPAGAAVISASFPRDVRARVQGAFDAGMFIGGATGIALGGIMAVAFGWRFAFFLVGIPGVVLGLIALRLPKSVASVAKESMPVRELLRVLALLAFRR